MLFKEVLIDLFHSFYGGLDEGLKCDLVDDPWEAFSEVEDQLYGIIGKEFFRCFDPFEVKADIVSGIIDGETSEVMGEDDPLF